MSRLSAILLTTSAVYASVATAHKSHTENNPLGNRWYHVGDGIIYPAIGTLEWSAGFPPATVDTTMLPQAWMGALNAAT
ncbi:hypothetical protein F4604DRAFT_1924350 [Suillus subluteus]|nr:hypothetical protein F4604DRAFT_1924350 [Suillus subluteus]